MLLKIGGRILAPTFSGCVLSQLSRSENTDNAAIPGMPIAAPVKLSVVRSLMSHNLSFIP